MITNLTLRGRMLVGFAVPVLVYIGLSGLVFTTSNKIFHIFEDIERIQKVILKTTTLDVAAQGMIRNLRGYAIINNPIFLKEYQSSLEAFYTIHTSLNKSVIDREQRERLQKMLVLVQNYNKFSEQMIALLKSGKKAEAVTFFSNGNGTKFVKEFDALNKSFIQAEELILEKETNEAKKALWFLITALIVGLVLLIVLSVAAALAIYSRVAGTIDRAVNEIASSSTQIAATVEEQERTASQQSASVNETTTTMDELGASSRATAEQAEAAVNAALEALNLTDGGSQAVGQTLEGMFILKERVGAIAQQIVKLSEQANQIGNISDLVSDLANQTNMLALNAAVEAVRAGEHGKGFAVVAAEIRKLADQSKTSAHKIGALVADVQNAINLTVMVTDEGTKTVEEGAKIAAKTSEAFTGVGDAVNNVVLNNQQISLNIKQQAIAIQQVIEAMNALNQGAKETASGITQTKIGTQNLNEAAIQLKTLV